MRKTTITLAEAAVLSFICFGFMIFVSVHAMMNAFPEHPFSDANMLYLVVLELIFGAAGLLYLRARGFDLASLAPRPRVLGAVTGVGLYATACFASFMITSPFAGSLSAEPIGRMISASALSLPVIVLFALVNGVFEEMFLLGVLARGLRSYGLSIAIGLPLLVRLTYHLYQGPLGALSIVAFGIVLTAYHLRFQTLWPPVFAHVLADIVPFL